MKELLSNTCVVYSLEMTITANEKREITYLIKLNIFDEDNTERSYNVNV